MEIALEPGLTLDVQVLDESGAPIPEAKIDVAHEDFTTGRFEPRGWTESADETGRLTLQRLDRSAGIRVRALPPSARRDELDPSEPIDLWPPFESLTLRLAPKRP